MPDFIKINKPAYNKIRVLIAPLDWGLGHSTRCIPIIKKLLNADYEVIIASEKAQMQLLKDEFPSLVFLSLPGYRLKYGTKNLSTVLKIILQIPKILIQINRENKWLNGILRQENIDIIISDNRYGLYSRKIISVFLTHQLYIKTVFGKTVERKLQQLNYKYINQFSVCWVPDFENDNMLAGELSHPKIFPKIPVQYIGPLSRFEKKKPAIIYKLLILLSGPEPQRTILENIFLDELKFYEEKTILIRGLPGEKNVIKASSDIEIHNHLSSSELNIIICHSEIVICRSGYSTIMDLARLGKNSIMIPTPGQTEQEYLADYLSQKKLAMKINQNDFSLREALEAFAEFSFRKYEEEENQLLDAAINKLTEQFHASKK